MSFLQVLHFLATVQRLCQRVGVESFLSMISHHAPSLKLEAPGIGSGKTCNRRVQDNIDGQQ